MAYRKHRKFKGTWFPMFGTVVGENSKLSGIESTFELTNDAGSVLEITAIVPDQQENSDLWEEATTSIGGQLGNITQGTEYALRRLVGKFAACITEKTGSPVQPAVTLGLGFFIADQGSGDYSLPVGASQAIVVSESGDAEDVQTWKEYSPLSQFSQRSPWIWRRTWQLSQVLQADAATRSELFPVSTAGYGSVMDGPHIDAKTRRRIHSGERLFMAVSASLFPATVDDTTGSYSITYRSDLRLFGAMRRARDKGAF